MSKSKVITVLSAAIVGMLGVIVGMTLAGNPDNSGDGPTVSQTNDALVTVAPSSDSVTVAPTESTAQSTTVLSTAVKILGKWSDSTKMSGYEFFDDGTVIMTYVNLTVPIINLPIDGKSNGVYTLEGNTLTTKFSIYSATITHTYTVSVENNVLTMYDTEEKETATYMRDSSSDDQSTTEYISYVDELIGSWVKSDGVTVYSFKDDGVLSLTLAGQQYTGVYLTEGKNVILQYTADGEKTTEKYTFTVSKNNLTLTSDSETKINFTRQGTSATNPVSNNGLTGKWTDSTKMSGYEFREGGVVVITYMNFTVPVINMPITGTYEGSYTVKGDTLTISYSVYSNSIVDTFEYEISDNVLTLYSVDGDMSTYIRA